MQRIKKCLGCKYCRVQSTVAGSAVILACCIVAITTGVIVLPV